MRPETMTNQMYQIYIQSQRKQFVVDSTQNMTDFYETGDNHIEIFAGRICAPINRYKIKFIPLDISSSYGLHAFRFKTFGPAVRVEHCLAAANKFFMA